MGRSLLAFGMVILLLLGCANGNEEPAGTIVEEGEEEVEKKELDFKVVVNPLSNQVEFLMTVTNHSTETKKLKFSTSQKYEIIVKDANEQEVYRYSQGKMFAQVMEDALIKPEESKQWNEVWDFNSQGIKPGKYEAELTILARNEEKLVETVSFQIPE
ncbi:hypothetical protein WQ54_03000 [Bacillus sp. SA1-12]|uniref:BsuPI-related putative proteinase inhibitor n=1 Tax=Bacillus sp. SA1-12 TaxID=1455638 RepID=UPI000626E116|nr:BsuPI-related putative proteinase inhibitor [Bacillus sp. SA1-12]KKI93593.1 hypothetical protein WQ54_03000 [Bacillus sp. SA1-12]